MEKVYELAESGEHDLIVVDTPPSQHALDFLEAPQRLVEFLDSRLVNLLVHPAMAAGRFGFKLFHRTSQRVLHIIERISGVGFLEDISEFLLAIEGMSAGFRERATEVRRLLLGRESAFLVVAGPSPQAARSAFEFLTRMRGTGVPVEGVLMNRVRLWPDGEPIPPSMLGEPIESSDLDTLARALAPELKERNERNERREERAGGAHVASAREAARTAVEVAKRYASLVQQDHQSAAPLREHAARNQQLFGCIPELPRDVCDLESLARVGDVLFRGVKLPDTTESASGADRHAS
jgi:anion-transporting  ArsA/GET3 family ATPase